MNRPVVLWLLLLGAPAAALADDERGDTSARFIIRVEGKYGFIDRLGREVIPPRFEAATDFAEGLAAVFSAEKLGYVDLAGRWVIEPRYDQARDFRNGFGSVELDGRTFPIDRSGKAVTPHVGQRWDSAHHAGEGLFTFHFGGKDGLFDRTGRVVLAPEKYEGVWGLENGWAQFRMGGRFGELPGRPRSYGIAGAKYGLLQKRGDKMVEALPATYDGMYGLSEGFRAVKVGNLWGYITASGEMKIKPAFEMAADFHQGVAQVKVDGKWGLIDTSGRLILAPSWGRMEPFADSLAVVCLKRAHAGYESMYPGVGTWDRRAYGEDLAAGVRWGYINRSGKQVIESRFLRAGDFSNGLAPVILEDGRPAYIDRTGKTAFVIDRTVEKPAKGSNHRPVYHEVFKDGLARVTFNRSRGMPPVVGYIDPRGRFVWGPTDGNEWGADGNEVRDRMKADRAIREVFALRQKSWRYEEHYGLKMWREGGNFTVDVYDDRTELTWTEAALRHVPKSRQYRWRLSTAELAELRKALSGIGMDTPEPALGLYDPFGSREGDLDHIIVADYLHVVRRDDGRLSRRGLGLLLQDDGLDKAGDRGRLLRAFWKLLRGRDVSRPRYRMADTLPGLRVLLTDPDHMARAVWARGDDLRVLVEEDPKPYQGTFVWRPLREGKVGDSVDTPPTGFSFDLDGTIPNARKEDWTVFGPGYELHLEHTKGLFRADPGQKEKRRLAEGTFSHAVILPGGKQAVAGSFETRDCWLVDLLNGGAKRIDMPRPDEDGFQPLCWVPAHRKVLLGWSYGSQETEDGYLYDPATGTVEKVTGQFEPMRQARRREPRRPIQPTARPGELWVTIKGGPPYVSPRHHSRIGRYDTRTFQFREVLRLPGVLVDTYGMWVDEPAGVVYFVYDGQLLSVPLPSAGGAAAQTRPSQTP